MNEYSQIVERLKAVQAEVKEMSNMIRNQDIDEKQLEEEFNAHKEQTDVLSALIRKISKKKPAV